MCLYLIARLRCRQAYTEARRATKRGRDGASTASDTDLWRLGFGPDALQARLDADALRRLAGYTPALSNPQDDVLAPAMLCIADELRDDLLKGPEYGMGYQRALGGSDHWIVLNAEFAVLADEQWRVSDHEHAALEQLRVCLLAGQDGPLDIEPYSGDLKVQEHGSHPSTTRTGEVLLRYSAFHPDRRIASDGSVLGGTYVTTANDGHVVPSGLAAVARYALPNPAPAIHKYEIHPPTGCEVLCGTCTPLFGQAGGGVELRLANPLPAGSARLRPPIPER